MVLVQTDLMDARDGHPTRLLRLFAAKPGPLPVSDPGRSFYREWHGVRGWGKERVPESESVRSSRLLKLSALSGDAATHSGESHP